MTAIGYDDSRTISWVLEAYVCTVLSLELAARD